MKSMRRAPASTQLHHWHLVCTDEWVAQSLCCCNKHHYHLSTATVPTSYNLTTALELLLFNGPLYGTTRVSRYQKGKTDLDFTEARDSEWQWHQLGHMQVCISLQKDNHASTPPLSFFYMPDALPAAQPTASKHWRHEKYKIQLRVMQANRTIPTNSHQWKFTIHQSRYSQQI